MIDLLDPNQTLSPHNALSRLGLVRQHLLLCLFTPNKSPQRVRSVLWASLDPHKTKHNDAGVGCSLSDQYPLPQEAHLFPETPTASPNAPTSSLSSSLIWSLHASLPPASFWSAISLDIFLIYLAAPRSCTRVTCS